MMLSVVLSHSCTLSNTGIIIQHTILKISQFQFNSKYFLKSSPISTKSYKSI